MFGGSELRRRALAALKRSAAWSAPGPRVLPKPQATKVGRYRTLGLRARARGSREACSGSRSRGLGQETDSTTRARVESGPKSHAGGLARPGTGGSAPDTFSQETSMDIAILNRK